MNFSTRQYQEREECNRRDAEYNWMPEPFDECREIEWTPVWSLTEERFKYAATAWCYFGIRSARNMISVGPIRTETQWNLPGRSNSARVSRK